MKKGVFWIYILIQFLVAPAIVVMGQSGNGTISGTVTDDKGAVVPGVEVTATNIDTKQQTNAVSNESGLYTVINLQIGNYTLNFQRTGFKTYSREGVTVAINQVVNLPVQLSVGGVEETVTINEDASILRTETSEVGTTMKSKVVTDLPLNISGGRSLESFAYAVTPSVEGNNWTSYIAGSPSFTKEVVIDGTSAVLQIGGHIGESSPTMEAVQEFKVETSGMSAEYGRTGGGLFNFGLKSGTNDFHGSAFGFLRNEALNANTWENNRLGGQRARDRQYITGFSAGGPVILPRFGEGGPAIYNGKDRTFIFGAYERYHQSRLLLGAMNRTVPVPAFLNGDFGQLLDKSTQLGSDPSGNPIYKGAILDPKTGLVFPNNVIPQNRISARSKQITDIYRQSYQPMVPGLLINNSAIPFYNDPLFTQDQITFKADHNLTSNSKISGSYIWTQRPRTLVDAGGIWDPNDAGNTGGPLSRARTQDVGSRQARFTYTYTFSPTLLNVANFNYGMYRNPSLANSAKDDWPATLGFGSTGAGNFPEVNFGGAVNGVGTSQIGYSSSGYYVANNYIVSDNLSWVRGRHSLKFGGETRQMQMNSHNGTPTLGFNFSNNTTGVPGQKWSSQVGFGFASFLLGEVESASQNVPVDLYGRRNYIAFFAQDDFKATRKLTLNLGLRWEQTGPLTEKYGHWSNYNTEKINSVTGRPGVLEFAGDGNTSFEGKRDWMEFGPRLGLAYQVTPRAVIRASYGIFYSPVGLNFWSGVPYGFAPGFSGTNRVTSRSDLKPAFNWDQQGYPGKLVPGKQDPNFVTWGMVTMDPHSLQAGRVHQWNIGTEFEMTKDLRLSVNYLGNRGTRLQSGDLGRNQPDKQAWSKLLASGKEWNWVSDPASAAAAGVPYPYPGFANSAFFALFPYPQVAEQWGPLFYVNSPLGRSDYNALQVTVTKRMSKGISADMSYTLSRARGNVESGFQELWWSGPVQDVTQLNKESKTVLSYDQTHIFKGYAQWELPFGRGRHFLKDSGGAVDALLGGWTLSTVFRYNTGNPLSIYSSAWMPGWSSNGYPLYVNVNSGANFSNQFNSGGYVPGSNNPIDSNRFFDQSAFSNPGYGQLGNGQRNYSQLRGFGFAREDLGIMKNFVFGERGYRLQLRAEFINAFNRHYFSNPTTDIGSNLFGYVTSTTGEPRQGQVGIRFEW